MIIENKVIDTQVIGHVEDSFEAEIDLDNIAHIIRMLSKMYRNPKAIIIQEYLSNAWDSHVEAGVTDKPIVLSIHKIPDSVNLELTFTDYGTGLSPTRMRCFGGIGKSTKKSSISQIGGFGVGSKSGYAYTDTFEVKTCCDGIEYHYICSKSEKDLPKYDLIYSTESTQDNYTSVIFEIRQSELSDFVRAIKDKALLFDNLYFDLDPELEIPDFNKSEVFHIEGTDLYYAPDRNATHFYMILNQVPYVINYTELGISNSKYSFPFGMKIHPTDPIQPLPTREDIEYNDVAREFLRQKLENQFALFNEKIIDLFCSNVPTLEEWLNNVSSNSRGISMKYLGIDVKRLVSFEDTKFPEILQPLSSFVKSHEEAFKLITDTYMIYRSYRRNSFNYKITLSDSRIEPSIKSIFYSDDWKQRTYLDSAKNSRFHTRETITGTYYILRKKRNLSRREYKYYKDKYKFTANQFREFMKLIDTIYKQLFVDYLSLEPIKRQRKVKSKEAQERAAKSFKVKKLRQYANDSYQVTSDDVYLTLRDIAEHKGLVVYGRLDDYNIMKDYYNVIPRANFLCFDYTVNVLSLFNNCINIQDIMNSRPFKRSLTALAIEELFKQYSKELYDIPYIKAIDLELAKALTILSAYEQKYKSFSIKDAIKQSMLAFLKENPNIIDNAIIDQWNLVHERLPKLNFLSLLAMRDNAKWKRFLDDDSLQITSFLLKHKFTGNYRMRLEHYQKGGVEKLIQELKQ